MARFVRARPTVKAMAKDVAWKPVPLGEERHG
jgi:hypothetical protein